MNLPESGSEARKRFEMQLGEFGIPLKFVHDIIGHHTLVSYNKGSMICLQGSPADLLFWVFTGLVKVYCPRSDGTRIMIKLGGPGDLIGHVDYNLRALLVRSRTRRHFAQHDRGKWLAGGLACLGGHQVLVKPASFRGTEVPFRAAQSLSSSTWFFRRRIGSRPSAPRVAPTIWCAGSSAAAPHSE